MADSKTIKPVLIKNGILMTISTGYKKLIRKKIPTKESEKSEYRTV